MGNFLESPKSMGWVSGVPYVKTSTWTTLQSHTNHRSDEMKMRFFTLIFPLRIHLIELRGPEQTPKKYFLLSVTCLASPPFHLWPLKRYYINM